MSTLTKNKLFKNPSIMIGIGCIIVWLINSISSISSIIIYYRTYIIGALLIMVLFGIVLWKERLIAADFESIAFLILISGFIIRALYILVAPYNISKHDLGTFTIEGNNNIDSGHLGYISYLYNYRQLPDFDPRLKWAFYNPPGFHIISAIWYGLNRFLGFSAEVCLENLQILTLAYATSIVIVVYKILIEFFEKNKILLIVLSFVSYFPFFSILGATLNNDCLATLCSMIAILYTIRWYRNQNLKNISIVAVSMGFGMFTKLNVGLLAFAIGFVFIYGSVKNIKEYKRYLMQFSLFGLICVPLGLFWPIRNYILYHMPITYIPRGSVVSQFVGEHNTFSRIALPSLKQISYPFIRFDSSLEHNIWVQLIRTGLYDEIMPPDATDLIHPFALGLLWISLALGVITIVLFVRTACKKRILGKEMKLFFSIAFLTQMISFVQFCYSYPMICTMNFRYVVILILLPCLAWGSYLNEENKGRLSRRVFTGLLGDFIALSIVMNLVFIIWAPYKY